MQDARRWVVGTCHDIGANPGQRKGALDAATDHVLVIGRGRLIADMSVAEITQDSALSHVRVSSPRSYELIPHLEAHGARVTNGTPDELSVTGIDASVVGAIAFEHGIPLTELSTQRASLEDAFMELTRDSVEFRAGNGVAATPTDVIDDARTFAGRTH